MMGAFLDKNTCVGLILGTGSNACYLERADRVENWETKRHGEKEVINSMVTLARKNAELFVTF